MTTALSPEMEALKTRLRTTWIAGDFSKVAEHIETTASDFVDRLEIQPGMKVLDVACGSGNLAIFAARKGAAVTGIDIAPNLVEAARKRAADAGLSIKFDAGDAEDMPYDDTSFDVVMTMFGAMFAPRPDVTAAELIRVCKPGGTIAMANWTPTGFAGQMFKSAGKYLPPPNMPPPVQWGVAEIAAERLGDHVSSLTCTPRLADMTFEFPPADVVEFFKTYFGPTVMAFKAIAPEHHHSFTSDLELLWMENNIATDGTTLVKSEYLEVLATRR